MGSLFEDLREGLQEAIDLENGNISANKSTYVIMPIKEYNCGEIKSIRNNAGMTQAVFAEFLGVSQKTVEAWERGRTHPTGPAYRLIEMLDGGKLKDLDFIYVEKNEKNRND